MKVYLSTTRALNHALCTNFSFHIALWNSEAHNMAKKPEKLARQLLPMRANEPAAWEKAK